MTEWKVSLAQMNEQTDSTVNEQKILSLIGLSVKAGKVIFGVPMICEALKKGGKNTPVVVLEASDTSENTHKKITDKCKFYGVEHIRLCHDGARLAQAVGKTSHLGALALTDQGLCFLVKKYI